MSENTPETPAQPEQTPNEQPAAKSFTQDDVNAMLARQKREQFGDYGDLKTQAAELAALKEAQQTEAEKVAARAAAAEQERDAARAESMRYKAAALHGVNVDNFDLLGTGTEEEVAARAERIGGLLKVQAENEQMKAELEALRAGRPAPTTSRPTTALKPGATPEQTQSEDAEYAAMAAALNLPTT